MFQFLDDTKVPPDKYFISDNDFLHKIVRKDDALFHALVVPIAFSKYMSQVQKSGYEIQSMHSH